MNDNLPLPSLPVALLAGRTRITPCNKISYIVTSHLSLPRFKLATP